MENISPATWGGTIKTHEIGIYTENYLLLIMGGIPWQVFTLAIFPDPLFN
jgi:high affinity choline transporter 7